jgi:hypothetical protein
MAQESSSRLLGEINQLNLWLQGYVLLNPMNFRFSIEIRFQG